MMSDPSTTSNTTLVNGLDADALKDTIRAVQQRPALAGFQFRAANRWLGAARNRSTIQGFFGCGQEDFRRQAAYTFECDEPPVLNGQDLDANPVEYLLHALAGCVTTSLVMHAASRGIEVRSVESKLEGDLDIQGFLGLSNAVPRGYTKIRVTMRVDSDAPVETLRALAQYSPVLNTIVNATPVEVEIVTPG